MNVKQVISRLSDFSSISPDVDHIHLRKFASRNVIRKVICLGISRISFSRYAYDRLSDDDLDLLAEAGISVSVSANRGRPGLIQIYSRSKR